MALRSGISLFGPPTLLHFFPFRGPGVPERVGQQYSLEGGCHDFHMTPASLCTDLKTGAGSCEREAEGGCTQGRRPCDASSYLEHYSVRIKIEPNILY